MSSSSSVIGVSRIRQLVHRCVSMDLEETASLLNALADQSAVAVREREGYSADRWHTYFDVGRNLNLSYHG